MASNALKRANNIDAASTTTTYVKSSGTNRLTVNGNGISVNGSCTVSGTISANTFAGVDDITHTGGNPGYYGIRAFVTTNNTTSIRRSKGISSVSEPNGNRKRINFSPSFPDANYTAVVTAELGSQLYGTIDGGRTSSYVTADFSDDSSLNAVSSTHWIVTW